MELEERLSYLENVRDWQSLVEELEKGIASSAANAAKAQFHLKLGRVLETKFLAGVKALKHFQDAYKLNPALTESLEAARNVYWDLGKLNMVQKLLELELKAGADGAAASALLLELGDVLCDQGDWEKAAATYARSIGMAGGKNAEASACLADVQLEAGELARAPGRRCFARANEATDAAAKARVLLRAARVARRFAPEEAEGMLARAYTADAVDRQTAALYEGLLAEQGRFDVLEQAQHQILAADGRSQRARAARARHSGRAGSCATRTSTPARASSRRRSSSTPRTRARSSSCARRTARRAATGTASSRIAEEAATRADDGGSTFLLAQAGLIAWRQLGNLIRARLSFERLSAVSPEHPQLRAFEAQIGETLKPARSSKQTAPRPHRQPGPTTRSDVAARSSRSRRPARQCRWTRARSGSPRLRRTDRGSRRRRAPAAARPAAAARCERRTTAKIAELRAAWPRSRSGQALQRVRQDAPPARGARARRGREGRALHEGGRPLRLQVRRTRPRP